MADIPDHWPPEEADRAAPDPPGPVVPVFPLPNVFLFPRQLMPLHVFEPRYRQMIEDSLDGPGRLVLGTIREGQEHDAHPEILPVAGLAEIVRHDKTDDGRFIVWLLGLGRVRLFEVASDRMYRRVRVAPHDEIEPPTGDRERLRTPLYAAVRQRSEADLELPDDLPTGLIADLLAQRLSVPQGVMERIFSERDAARRAELALAAHARYPEG